ncbi:hypothetical protein, partial [Klebsiella pneumoniae]|uniref:hypothetical protein n=1 Tax=Klebsiella pneumoniae TaxID=573 RepID=UPI001E5C42AC
KDWDKPKLKEIFSQLEFKTLGKRLLGEEFAPAVAVAPDMVQTDLFGNIVEPPAATGKTAAAPAKAVSDEEAGGLPEKNIHNTPHRYEAIADKKALGALVKKLEAKAEICVDTETTGIDANT